MKTDGKMEVYTADRPTLCNHKACRKTCKFIITFQKPLLLFSLARIMYSYSRPVCVSCSLRSPVRIVTPCWLDFVLSLRGFCIDRRIRVSVGNILWQERHKRSFRVKNGNSKFHSVKNGEFQNSSLKSYCNQTTRITEPIIIHSNTILYDDGSTTSFKVIFPTLWCFLFQFTVSSLLIKVIQ